MKVGRALHWRHRDPCALDDVMRVVQGERETLAAIAAGYDSGFSTGWAAGSRLILDLLVDAWHRDPATAFAAARSAYLDAARPLVPPDDDFGDTPAASLLVARILDRRVELEWLGEGGALIARDGELLARTRRHILRDEYADRFPPDTDLSKVPNVLTRVIGATPADSETLTVAIVPGDRVILASTKILDALSSEEIAAERGDPAAAADALLTRSVAAGDPWSAYVAVLDYAE